jgi:hypothetical protein
MNWFQLCLLIISCVFIYVAARGFNELLKMFEAADKAKRQLDEIIRRREEL